MPKGSKKEKMSATQSCGASAKKRVPKKGKPLPETPDKTYSLKVQVQHKGKDVSGASVTVDGVKKSTGSNGLADFGKKPAGKYSINVDFPSDSDYVDLENPTKINLQSNTIKKVHVKIKNFVSAKIECEYKVVLADRNVSTFQEKDETKILTDNVTYVKITFDQTNNEFPYDKDAILTCSGAGSVDLFSDEKCETAFDGKIKNSDIVSGKSINYFLKSKSIGAFTTSLELPDSSDKKVMVKTSKVEEKMAVGEVQLNVFKNDHNKLKSEKIIQDTDPISKYHDALKDFKIPPQKVMTDEDKIKNGRFLHLQKDENHARAKIEIKINTDHWPSECDDYTLTLVSTCNSGGIKIFDKEWQGTEVSKDVIKISDLKSGGKKELWVEGSGENDKLIDINLSLKLNRKAGAISHKEKKNADWARFTVVKIEEVKLKFEAVKGEAKAWNEADKKFYINFKKGVDGRKITIHAKLSKKLSGIPIHFILAGDKGNRKKANWGVDMPIKWKWEDIKKRLKSKDKNKRNALLHLKKATNDDGEAEMELILSRFGGEKYTPACYIHEDPHLCKYIDGHTELEKKKPVLSNTTIQVGRKFWIRKIRPEIMTDISLSDSDSKLKAAKLEMEMHNKEIVLKTADIKAKINAPAFYKEYMIRNKGSDKEVFVKNDYERRFDFYDKFTPEADKPVMLPMLLCASNIGNAEVSDIVNNLKVLTKDFPHEVETEKTALLPIVNNKKGKLLVSGKWILYKKKAAPNKWKKVESGKVDAADVVIKKNRTYTDCYHINVPKGIKTANTSGMRVKFMNLSINVCNSYCGEYDPGNKCLLAAYDPDNHDDFHNTVVHELGHAFRQVVRLKDSRKMGVPKHPFQKMGAGNHCLPKSGLGDDDNANADCVMFVSGPAPKALNFCEECQPYIIASDYSSFAGP